MGRWYYGDIHGKCWFGVQDSDDASNFGVEPTEEFSFHGCGCSFEPAHDEEEDKLAFCSDCYESYEEHIKVVQEELEDPEFDSTWSPDGSISYDFCEGDLTKVKEVVKQLDKEVGHYLKDFKLEEDQGEGITYDFEFSNKRLGPKKHEKIARLCLGLQIINSIETKGQCCFSVET
jgi:hypothetical protein